MYEKSFENLLKDKINHKQLKYITIKCLIDDIIKIYQKSIFTKKLRITAKNRVSTITFPNNILPQYTKYMNNNVKNVAGTWCSCLPIIEYEKCSCYLERAGREIVIYSHGFQEAG